MKSLEEYLAKNTLLNVDDIASILTFFEHSKFKKGGFFSVENQVCDKLGFVIEGGFKAFSIDPEGRENITCFKFEEQFIASYESFSHRRKSNKSIQATENSEILIIDANRFKTLVSRFPALNNLSKVILEHEFSEKENYLLTFNNKTASEKYLKLMKDMPEVVRRVAVNDIASYLGMTQRSLTRIKREVMLA
jgi:CRP-like cAMP-binding protein